METIWQIITAVLDQSIEVLRYPLDPGNRIYVAYLGSSTVIAWFIYRAIRRKGHTRTQKDADLASGTFLRFLFPKHVWEHPSAWLDLRYFFFHKVISHFLLLGVGSTALGLGFMFSSGGMTLADLVNLDAPDTQSGLLFAIAFMMVAMIVLDFTGWVIHYLQHKVPLLWQFHKVHHSAEVMHPVSNYREHPIDNLAYIFFTMLGYGALHGFAVRYLGYLPTIPTLLGVPLLMLTFNLIGYNLRHSHIWLRWPGRWSMAFPSPAHHHVHHSCHPDHIDKNFAFFFPIWDVIFKTYHLPEDDRDVKFGIPEYDSGKEFTTCLRLYFLPFRDAYRLFRKPKNKSACPPPVETGIANIPAE